MSGQKGMKYFGNAIIEEVLRLREEGKNYHEFAKHFKLRNIKVIRNLTQRHRKKKND